MIYISYFNVISSKTKFKHTYISEHKNRKDESKMQQIKDQRRRVVVVIMEVGIITLGVVGNSNLITSCSRLRPAPRNAESYLIFSNFRHRLPHRIIFARGNIKIVKYEICDTGSQLTAPEVD